MRGPSAALHRLRRGPRLGTAVLLACAACAGEDGSAAQAARPPLAVVDLEGLVAGLAAHRGSGQLVNFWALWCKPCVAELPELAQVAGEYRSRGGRVVGVSYDLMVPFESVEAVTDEVDAFLDANGYAFPVLVYDADDYDAINARFDLPGPIPVTLALDAEGRIVDREEGAAGLARFRAMMEAALGD